MRYTVPIIAFLTFVVFVVVMIFLHKRHRSAAAPFDRLHESRRNISTSHSPASPPFDFVPAAFKNFYECDDLFGPDTAAAGFQLSSEFQAGFPAFEFEAKKSKLYHIKIYGHTGKMASLYKTIHYLASRSNVHNICETGFHLGHSSFNYLTANRYAIVHSFDIGNEDSPKMASFLRDRFPGRFFLHVGNSIQKVPEFARMHPDHSCDFILVDGGHDYKAAMADLLNMAAMANVDTGNIVVLDDYPTLVPFPETGWAWENMRRWGYVRELMRCLFPTHKDYPNRGFVVGTVVRRPILST